MYRAYKVKAIIIGSGKSLFSPRVFLHRLGLTTTNTRNLALQTIRVRPSCKRYGHGMSRWFVSLAETTCIFSDVLAWPGRRWLNVNETTSCFRIRHISIRVPRSESGRSHETQQETRKRQEEWRTVVRDPRSPHWTEPMLVVTHERVLAKDDETYSYLVLLCTHRPPPHPPPPACAIP